VPCIANEALCDLLSLEGLPVATRKRPRELMRDIRLVRSSENSSSTRNFGFSGHCFPDGQYCCEQLQMRSSKRVWELETRGRDEKIL